MDLLGGLNQDFLFEDQPMSTYRWALNWIVNQKEGTLQSEPGFDFQFKLRDNLKPIGLVELSDGVVIFSTNDDSTDCEIGLFTEVPKSQWAINATTKVDFPANSYIPILNDAVVSALNNGTGTTTTDLNFSQLHQIQGVYRYNNVRELEVAFTDWFNVPRVLYLGDFDVLKRYYQPYSAITLDVFQRFNVADVDRTINASGSIPSGTYFLFYRYQNADLSTTQVVVADRPIYITSYNDDTPGNTWGDAVLATPTNKGISVTFNNVDTAFPNLQIGLFRVNDNKAVIITSQSINGPNIPEITLTNFVGDGTEGSGDLEGGNLNLLVQEIRYVRAKTVGVQGSRLYFGNLIGNDSLENGISQKYVNSSKVEWVLDIIDTQEEILPDGSENNIKSYNNYYDQNYTKSFQAGEVYAFFCRARLKDGTLSPWFHIPGQESEPFKMLVVPPTLISAPYSIGGISPTDKIEDVSIITEGVDEFTMDKEITGGDPNAEVYQLRDTVSYEAAVWNDAFMGNPNKFGFWENKGERYDQYFLTEDLDIIDAAAYASGIVTKKLSGNVKHNRFPSNFWINNAWHAFNSTLFYDRDKKFKDHAANPTHDLFITKMPRLGVRFTPPFLPPEIQETVDYWEIGYAGRDGQNCTILAQDLSLFGITSSKDDGNTAAVIQDIDGVARGVYRHYRDFDNSSKYPSGVTYSKGTSLTGYTFVNNIDSQSTYNATYYGDDPADQTKDVGGGNFILEADGGVPKLPKTQFVVHPDVVQIGSNTNLDIGYVSYEVFLNRRVVNPEATANNPGQTRLGKQPDLGISYNYPAFYLPADNAATSLTSVKSLGDPTKSVDLKYDNYPGRGVPIKNNPEYPNNVTPDYAVEAVSDTSLSSVSLNRRVFGTANINLDSSSIQAGFIPGYPDLAVTSGNPIEGYEVNVQPKIPASQIYRLSFNPPAVLDKLPYVLGPLGGRSAQHYGKVSAFTADSTFNPNNFSDVADFLTHMDRPPEMQSTSNLSVVDITNDDTLLGNRFTNGHSYSQNGMGNHSRKDILCTYRRYTNNVYSGLFNSLGIMKAGETNKEQDLFFGDVFLTKVNYKFRGLSRSNDTELTVQSTVSGSRIGASSIGGIVTPYFFAYTVGEGTFKKVSFKNVVKVTEINFFGTTRKNLSYRDLDNYNIGYPDCNNSNLNYDVQNSFFPKTETSLKTLDASVLAGKYPFRVIWSELQGTDAKINNWRKFKSTNLYEMDKVKGEVVNLQGYDEQLLIHTERSLWFTRPVARLALADGTNYQAILGTGQIFDPAPQEIQPNPLGIGGTVHQFSCKLSKQGYSFVDANTGRFYLYRKEFGPVIGDLGELGLYQFLQTYANVDRNDFSNNRAAGISAFCSYYDPYLRRIIFGYNQNGIALDETNVGDWQRQKESSFEPYTISISEVLENKLAFTSFHDYHPDLATATLLHVYSFKDQRFYKHNSPSSINKFYHNGDDQEVFNSVLDIVFNTTKIRTQDGGTVEGAKNALKQFQSFKWQTQTSLLGPNPPSNDLRERYIETFDFATVYTNVQLSERVSLIPFQTTRMFDGVWNFNKFRDNLQRNSYPSTNRLEDFVKFIGDPITGYSLDYTKLDPAKPYNKRFVDTYCILRLEASPLYTLQGGSPEPIKQISVVDVDSLNITVTK